jgi:replicative DNA helicase
MSATATLDRVLPHDLQAERAVLGAVLAHPELILDAASIVSPHDFFRVAHRLTFAEMLALDARKTAIDFVTLRASLETIGKLDEVGGPAYLTALVDGVPRSTNAVHYAEIVRHRALLRQLVLVGNKMNAEAYEAEDPAPEILDRALKALFNVVDSSTRGGLVSLRELVPKVMDALEERHRHRRAVTGVASGFRDLDGLTCVTSSSWPLGRQWGRVRWP